MSEPDESAEQPEDPSKPYNPLLHKKPILKNTLHVLRRQRTRSSSVPSKRVSFADTEKGLPLKQVYEFPKDELVLPVKSSACCTLF